MFIRRNSLRFRRINAFYRMIKAFAMNLKGRLIIGGYRKQRFQAAKSRCVLFDNCLHEGESVSSAESSQGAGIAQGERFTAKIGETESFCMYTLRLKRKNKVKSENKQG